MQARTNTLETNHAVRYAEYEVIGDVSSGYPAEVVSALRAALRAETAAKRARNGGCREEEDGSEPNGTDVARSDREVAGEER